MKDVVIVVVVGVLLFVGFGILFFGAEVTIALIDIVSVFWTILASLMEEHEQRSEYYSWKEYYDGWYKNTPFIILWIVLLVYVVYTPNHGYFLLNSIALSTFMCFILSIGMVYRLYRKIKMNRV